MKNIQIPQELFMKLLRYHLIEDFSCEDDIKKGLEQKMDAMVMRELYTKRKLHHQKKNGKKLDRNIWTSVEYRTASDGNCSCCLPYDRSVSRTCG